MDVDGEIIKIEMLIIGRINKGVKDFEKEGEMGKWVKDEKLGKSKSKRIKIKGEGMEIMINEEM